jgi:hypothetical protein
MRMTHKYGIYQSTSKSCIFYKQDEDGNQSTFNIFVTPLKEKEGKNEIIAFIDNEQMKKENWVTTKDADIKDIVKAFNDWAEDAPLLFELEAQKSMVECFCSILKKE